MPKVKLIFVTPDEKHELDEAMNGAAWHAVVTKMDEWLRSKIKYEQREELQDARNWLHELIDEEGLRLWE